MFPLRSNPNVKVSLRSYPNAPFPFTFSTSQGLKAFFIYLYELKKKLCDIMFFCNKTLFVIYFFFRNRKLSFWFKSTIYSFQKLINIDGCNCTSKNVDIDGCPWLQIVKKKIVLANSEEGKCSRL